VIDRRIDERGRDVVAAQLKARHRAESVIGVVQRRAPLHRIDSQAQV
jgi:hypothetical protein